jgi:hypothetical protein
MSRFTIPALIELAAAIAVSGCAVQGGTDAELGDIASKPQKEQTQVFNLATFSPIANTVARLSRESASHECEEDTRQLPAGHAVILSYIAYNAPENCTNPTPFSWCSFPDAQNPATEPSLQVIDGTVVAGDGEADFGNIVGLGVDGAAGQLVFGGGLTNVQGSEVHYLTTDKGTPISGRLEEQLTTFSGGCDVRQCVDLQFALFRGPDGG